MRLSELLYLYIKEYFSKYNDDYIVRDLKRSVSKNLIEPLNDKEVSSVNAFDIQEIYNILINDGWKSSTLYIFDSNIRRLFDYALNKSIISRTPFAFVPRPQISKTSSGSLYNPETVSLIFKAARTWRFGRVFLILMMTGMRVSELISLRNDDINLSNRVISIKFERPARNPKGKVFSESKKKREIVISQSVAKLMEEEMMDVRDRINKPRSIFNNKYNLFFTHNNGMPLTTEILRDSWNVMLDSIGLERVNLNNFSRIVFAKSLSKEDAYDRAIIHYLGLESTTQYYEMYKYIS